MKLFMRRDFQTSLWDEGQGFIWSRKKMIESWYVNIFFINFGLRYWILLPWNFERQAEFQWVRLSGIDNIFSNDSSYI